MLSKRPSVTKQELIGYIKREVEDYYSPFFYKFEPETTSSSIKYWFCVIGADKNIVYYYGQMTLIDSVLSINVTKSNSKVVVPKKGYITDSIYQTFTTKVNEKLKDSFCFQECNNTDDFIKLVLKEGKSYKVELGPTAINIFLNAVETAVNYTFNKFLPKPMLAHKLVDKDVEKITNSFVVIQPKYNGHRCLASFVNGVCVTLSSRDGEIINYPALVDSINAYCKANLSFQEVANIKFLDGELYKHGLPLQTITSIVNTVNKFEKDLDYIIYDACPIQATSDEDNVYDAFKAPYFKLPLEDRNFVFKITASIKARTSTLVQNPDYLIDKHKAFTDEGYEGIMIRTSKTYFEDFRSRTLLKLKTFLDDEFLITGYLLGKRQEEDLVITLVTNEGKAFKAKPIGTYSEKVELRKQLDQYEEREAAIFGTVKFFEYTKAKIPMHPVFIAIR